MTTTAQALEALRQIADEAMDQKNFPAFDFIRQHIESTAAEIARLQAECEALRKDAEWRPIETAPTDGTRVLLGRHMGDFGFVRGHGYFEGTAGSFLSGWISSGFDPVMSNLGLGHPTHWKPLPAPPTTLSTSTAPSGAEE